MKQLLTAALVLSSLLSAQAAKADDVGQTSAPEITAPAPQPIIISWDRVGGKERGWV